MCGQAFQKAVLRPTGHCKAFPKNRCCEKNKKQRCVKNGESRAKADVHFLQCIREITKQT